MHQDLSLSASSVMIAPSQGGLLLIRGSYSRRKLGAAEASQKLGRAEGWGPREGGAAWCSRRQEDMRDAKQRWEPRECRIRSVGDEKQREGRAKAGAFEMAE